MLFIKVFLLLIISLNLFANNYLKSNYFITNDFVMLSDIINQPTKDIKLYNIDKNRYSKRVKSKDLLKLLKEYGYEDYTSKHNYVQFTKKSPIDRKKIISEIKKLYKKLYNDIEIMEINVEPRSYLESLPSNYSIVLRNKAHLSNSSTLYIKTLDNKKIFFNYFINAKVKVYVARGDIKKGVELSNINTKKKSIILDKFRAMPIQNINKSTIQTKHRLKDGTVLTKRDVIGLFLVKRGSNVNVILNNLNISISFSAKAVQNGRYGDTVSVIRHDGKKLKAVVTGKNTVEIK